MEERFVIEENIRVGDPAVIESQPPDSAFAVFFEDDGETAYLYALDSREKQPVLDALHIDNVESVGDRHLPSRVQIVWSADRLKAALIINECMHAAFDFENKRAYCRPGFPPINDWSVDGHEWDDKVIDLFG